MRKILKVIFISLGILFLILVCFFSIIFITKWNTKIPFLKNLNISFDKTNEQAINKDIVPTESITKKELTSQETIAKNEKFIVRIFCQANDGNVQATGVVIGRDMKDNLIVLTNYHVIENLKKLPNNPPCAIDTSDNEYYYAEPVFWEDQISKKDMWLVDFALLEVKREPAIERQDENGNEITSGQANILLDTDVFPDICIEDQLQIGKELVVLGYPGISNIDVPGVDFTSKFTATEGIISGKVSDSDYYFGTSAKIDSGNSGGGAFLKDSGCLAGVPTFVITGGSESMGKILNARKLKSDFLNKIIKDGLYQDYLNDKKSRLNN